MANQTAFFVQFPHPGDEHKSPKDGHMLWNTGKHRRKFLISPGRYQDGAGGIGEAELAFWGEWEPPSRVDQRWPASGQLPRALHRPYWGKPTNKAFRQNTDPWVFGDRMIYSNCRQVTGQHTPKAIQRLTPGSVICFGSTIDDQFCVDTVFVVASAEPWVPAKVASLKVDEAFSTCTADSLMTKGEDRHLPLTLYRGATFDNPVEGMFSFVPALRADLDEPRFERPRIDLPGFIKPSVLMSDWGSKRPLPIDTVRDAWDDVRRQVLDANLLLAVRLQTPPCVTDEVAVPESSRRRC